MGKVEHVQGSISLAVAAKLEEPLWLTGNSISIELNARQVNIAIFLLWFQRLANKVGSVAKPASLASPLVAMISGVFWPPCFHCFCSLLSALIHLVDDE
jgi:hypothetical protein